MRFDDRVAIVTGAGNGLGRAYALELARRGAAVVVNDLGAARDGTGAEIGAANAVTNEIRAWGGTAIVDGSSVTDPAAVRQMVRRAVAEFGRVDILINNAGILRDRSFSKMTLEDFRAVLDVHLMGSVHCTKAVWDLMRDQGYGRIVMTTSSAGLYGNFGQANYAAAKAGLVGLMNGLALEGARDGVLVNAISPAATTRMTQELLPEAAQTALRPEFVVPAVVYLSSEQAPNGTVVFAGAGGFACTCIADTQGVHFDPGAVSVEAVAATFDDIADRTSLHVFEDAMQEVAHVVGLAGAH